MGGAPGRKTASAKAVGQKGARRRISGEASAIGAEGE